MASKELGEIAAALASGYPDSDKDRTSREFRNVIQMVLPRLAERASLATDRGIENVTEVWEVIRENSEGLFEEAIKKVDRVKVIYVASKFMNNKSIGEMVTKEAVEAAKQSKEQS